MCGGPHVATSRRTGPPHAPPGETGQTQQQPPTPPSPQVPSPRPHSRVSNREVAEGSQQRIDHRHVQSRATNNIPFHFPHVPSPAILKRAATCPDSAAADACATG